jgi:phosphoglycolate phosphatase
LRIGAVLFDLDGTLVDTAPDLVAVLNRLLVEHECPPAPFAIARNEVSNGALGLIRLGFGPDLPARELEALRARFLEIYLTHLCYESHIFSGLEWLHDKTHEYSAPWGVVTNKPKAMTEPLLATLGLTVLAGPVVSGDSLPQRKPHPAPLLLAAQELRLSPAQCVYVGDAARDIEAGQAAGMRTVAAAWGYIRPEAQPSTWGADAVVRHPRELLAALDRLDSDRS